MTDACETPMRDHIAKLIQMLRGGERRLIVEHPNPAIGTTVFSPDVSVAVAAYLDTLAEQAAPVAVKPLRFCGYCAAWHSKPCGDGCVWNPSMPTELPAALASPAQEPQE